ncbi:hypothetical protein KIN20_013277 [Parelaphostrongylus tenuis]|uniref:Uncharacterized protein n=1 Tax=Parelaphostrongylus tenuis TaxID=148309 RepID=A0AAD5MXW5_PARTN|nr:hypothetical protein KIN20_013277 [Parelaphostrongylus tenuis]
MNCGGSLFWTFKMFEQHLEFAFLIEVESSLRCLFTTFSANLIFVFSSHHLN